MLEQEAEQVAAEQQVAAEAAAQTLEAAKADAAKELQAAQEAAAAQLQQVQEQQESEMKKLQAELEAVKVGVCKQQVWQLMGCTGLPHQSCTSSSSCPGCLTGAWVMTQGQWIGWCNRVVSA